MRRSHPDNKWIVTRKDDCGCNDQKYSFELKAERCDKDVADDFKYPWLVIVEGSRDIMPEGKLLVSFYKEGKKTDWITACYGVDGNSYETSLNK